ncbi:MAG: hypothetical protein Q9184_006683 [Pyrenodesmia sp. 2 TL-2023]
MSPRCVCMRYADANPDHPFCVTKKGEDLYRAWRIEQFKRNAEVFDVRTYNDYTGYGTGELCAFDEVISTEEKDIWMIWAHIEGMARFLSQDNDRWYHIDDSETNSKRVMLIGTAILTAIDRLIDSGLFVNDSEIRNIGFVLGLLLEFATEFEGTCPANEDGWRIVVIRKLGQHGVKIRATKRSELVAESVSSDAIEEKEDGDGDGDREEKDIELPNRLPDFVEAYKPLPYSPEYTNIDPVIRSWAVWDWKQELQEYTKHHGIGGKIGGDHYDLTVNRSDDESASDDWIEESSDEEEKPVGMPD